MNIIELIRKIRIENDYTYAELSSKLGISSSLLIMYEKGKRNPKIDFVEKLNKFVNETNVTPKTYIEKRKALKNKDNDNTLMYYDINASAGTTYNAEILPVKKSEGVLHINDLFKGSQYAIRISGNSMTPNYPSGAIIGIREVPDKIITPGSVYVIEKESDLWIKRLFYKDDNQNLGVFECCSDNTMKQESGARAGKFYYPSFEIAIDAVRKLFKVTGIYKPNELSVIN